MVKGWKTSRMTMTLKYTLHGSDVMPDSGVDIVLPSVWQLCETANEEMEQNVVDETPPDVLLM